MTQRESSAPGGRVRASDLRAMKRRGERIAVLTCYDHLFARLIDDSGVDAVLVGDSLGQVILGYDSTLPVTVDQMVHHTAAVRRGLGRPLLVADMPFLSYQTSDEDALRNAGRLVKEGGAEAVKLEGGDEAVLRRVEALVRAGIPVMGHLGLTPQSVNQLGYRVQGRDEATAEAIVEGAWALEEAGAFALVLECVPSELARRITEALSIPTIGIGAGPHTDAQVLVFHDLVGLSEGRKPRFVKAYADLRSAVGDAVKAFSAEVASGDYPGPEHTYE